MTSLQWVQENSCKLVLGVERSNIIFLYFRMSKKRVGIKMLKIGCEGPLSHQFLPTKQTTNKQLHNKQTLVHATVQTFQKLLNNDKAGLIRIDFKNALNSITRSSVLDAARKLIPASIPFASFGYFQHSKLFFKCNSHPKSTRSPTSRPAGALTVFFSTLVYYQRTLQ